jgi:hypothetical protein
VTVTDKHLESALANLCYLHRVRGRDIHILSPDQAAALLQHIAALQRDHAASAARVAAADALADAAYDALGMLPATVVTLAGRVLCQEYGNLRYTIAAYRALAQPDAARPAGEMPRG